MREIKIWVEIPDLFTCLPSRYITGEEGVNTTGTYQIRNKVMYVEFSMPMFLFFRRKVWVPEYNIRFQDIETFQCGENL